MDYFFKYALKIEPPDEYDLDPEKWLDPLERGSLLHTVFYRFMTAKAGKPVSIDRDLPLIERILDEEIAKELPLHPQPSDMVFERERRDLAKAAEIFLREEDIHCRAHRPFCFEAAIGLPPDNPGTPLDTSLPVAVPLGDGRSIRARGRIDRVDEIGRKGSGRFAAWDYKTGSTWGYTKDPPFWAGRCIQNILYLDLLQARLDEIKPGARAERFGYFFPTSRSHGERIQWEREDLEPGRKILALLCSMIAAGAFPASNDASDYKYSDYVAALGDPGRVIAELALKLGDPENDALKPYLELRGAKPKKG